MATNQVKPLPPWSAKVDIKLRTVCKICGHLHPGGERSGGSCNCCRNDLDHHGWAGH